MSPKNILFVVLQVPVIYYGKTITTIGNSGSMKRIERQLTLWSVLRGLTGNMPLKRPSCKQVSFLLSFSGVRPYALNIFDSITGAHNATPTILCAVSTRVLPIFYSYNPINAINAWCRCVCVCVPVCVCVCQILCLSTVWLPVTESSRLVN